MFSSRRPVYSRVIPALVFLGMMLAGSAVVRGQSAYVRVNQIGYEAGKCPFRAYLMSTVPQNGATFSVIDSKGQAVYSSAVGALLGTWSHSGKLSYQVYALDFSVPGHEIYTISVAGSTEALSPRFAVDEPAVLYPGLLLNTLFFYQTERDGPKFIVNALRTAPAHLKDANAQVYDTPHLDSNDFIHNVPPMKPLVPSETI
jgi:endoglucanase